MKKYLKQLPIIITVLAIVFALYYYIGCPIRFLTGMPCPGCGMRHALMYLLMGNVDSALSWHPLIFIMPIILLIIIFYRRFSSGSIIFLAIICVILFVGVYIYRVLDPNDLIIKDDFSQTIWHRWFNL